MKRFIAVMFGVCLLCAGRAQAQQVIPAPTSYTLVTFAGAVVDPNATGSRGDQQRQLSAIGGDLRANERPDRRAGGGQPHPRRVR
jgi:hypothetical protein